MADTTASSSLHPWDSAGKGRMDAASFEAWIDARLAAEQDAINRLLAVKGPRTLENTLRPYDEAQAQLASAGQQAWLMGSVHADKAIRDKGQALAQKVSDAGNRLQLNQGVYHALAALDLSGADPGTRHYVERALLEYRLGGVDRDEATRTRIQTLQEQLTEEQISFGRNVQENVNHFTVKSAAELDGLPADFLASHPPAADGSIILSTDQPDYQPVMTFARNEDVRRSMFLAYNTRAYPANRQVLLDMLKTRYEIAKTLSFDSWADFATADQMMGSAANLKAFLGQLDQASKPGAEKEYAMVLAFAQKQQPGLKAIDAASRSYWYEQYRRTAFDFDSQSVRPYFPYDEVQKGVLDAAQKLFHVRFEPATDASVWDPSVTAWDVFDGARQIGRFYLDMHPRDGKDKWFSASGLIPGVRGKQYPEAALICNFPGGKSGDLGLMQYDNVVTYFHEFGHLMHAILGGQQPYAGISGIATEGDFVEAPSQMLEEFFRDPKLLAGFARHYQTGEPIPAALVERMNRASAFGRADWVRTQIFYTTYSFDTHHLNPETLDLDKLQQDDYTRLLPYTYIDGNRMYASFTHLSGYSSNYYTYLFDKVIALDFFSQFDRHDLLGGPTAMRYRRAVLEPGGSKPGSDLVKDFLGRPQNLDAFKAWMNLEFAPPVAAD